MPNSTSIVETPRTSTSGFAGRPRDGTDEWLRHTLHYQALPRDLLVPSGAVCAGSNPADGANDVMRLFIALGGLKTLGDELEGLRHAAGPRRH